MNWSSFPISLRVHLSTIPVINKGMLKAAQVTITEAGYGQALLFAAELAKEPIVPLGT